MNSCPYCSHNLLRHLHAQNIYWYCSRCHLETPDSFITAQNKLVGHQALLSLIEPTTISSI